MCLGVLFISKYFQDMKENENCLNLAKGNLELGKVIMNLLI